MKNRILKRNTIIMAIFMLVLTILTIVSFAIVNYNSDLDELTEYTKVCSDQISRFESISDLNKFVLGKDVGYINITFFNPEGDNIASTYSEEIIADLDKIKEVSQKENRYMLNTREAPAKGVNKSLAIYVRVNVSNSVSPEGMFIVRFSKTSIVNSQPFWILIVSLFLFWIAMVAFLVFIFNHNIKISMAPLLTVQQIMTDISDGQYQEKKIAKSENSELSKMVEEIAKIGGMINQSMVNLENEKNKSSTILETMSQGIIVFDNDGNIVEHNELIEKMLGFNITTIEELKHIKEIEEIYVLFRQSFRERVEKETQIYINNKWLKMETAFVPENKEGYAMIALSTDVTDIMKANIAKGEFFANASHELKTPLTAISGYSEMLSLSPNEKQMKKCVKEIHKNSLKMKKLIDEMLQISKLDSLTKVEEKEDFSLYSLCKESMDDQLIIAKRKNISVEVDGDAIMHGNYKQILMVVKNLISNAIKYNNEGGFVKVEITDDSEFITLKVIDNGIGIAKENQDKIFDRFYKVDESHTSLDDEESSTGLGLSIVKNVVKIHNGSIIVNSELKKGTEFIIKFIKE